VELAFVAEVGEELAALDVLEEEVEEAIVLGEAQRPDLRLGGRARSTKKGCEMLERMMFSPMMWSTCFKRRISAFFSILIATYSSVCRFLASLTRPKEPVPKVFRIS